MSKSTSKSSLELSEGSQFSSHHVDVDMDGITNSDMT